VTDRESTDLAAAILAERFGPPPPHTWPRPGRLCPAQRRGPAAPPPLADVACAALALAGLALLACALLDAVLGRTP
jgi:hypothetical protein